MENFNYLQLALYSFIQVKTAPPFQFELLLLLTPVLVSPYWYLAVLVHLKA